MKFNTQVVVPDQIIKDMIITALEGGSNYWYFLPDLSTIAIIDGNYDANIGNILLFQTFF